MGTVYWLGAITPILVLLLVLVRWKWGGDKAGFVGLFTSILVAYFLFGGSGEAITLAVAKGMWVALSIILVIFPALSIYEVSREAGAFSAMRQGMQKFTPNKVLQVLAIGWIFVGFLQGITGFGVPVAVGAPLLIGLGVKPVKAVMITLLGQAWGNTFGTLGIAWEGLVGQVDLSDPLLFRQTLLWATGLLGGINLLAGAVIAWLAGGKIGLRHNYLTVLILGVIQGAGQMGLALLNPMLCNFMIVSLSLVVIFAIGRHPYYQREKDLEVVEVPEAVVEIPSGRMTINQAFLPYYFLVVATVVVLLNPVIKSFLGQWKFGFSFAAQTTKLGFTTKAVAMYAPIAPLIHSGAFLLTAAAVGYVYYRCCGFIASGGMGIVVKNSFDKTVPSAIAIVGLTAMSKVMDDTGQTMVLAQGVVTIAGAAYPLLAPFVGLLGTFMTSSNLSSNILFGGFQETVAGLLGVNKSPILAAQTAGGAIGSIIAPSKVLLGTSMAGILGREGDIIRKFFLGTMLTSGVIGIIVLLTLKLGS